ncbi:MAG: hypothetical protein P1U78_09450 [Alcanivoracaceae bacterium]|jgi:hypothetical protein|nr:hypothetical protein [Alcanivoracaceae bacterium]MDF1630004.1 hypothetical protein [Alcanivoracaceae bacterium]MDX5471726.1 hypothetical protein [Marinobacter sp.]PKM22589.1 MAG: hypothetical protein CVV10_03495 [Gammaproteobacteria bacterium HGW-Gammaproteobacteria-14]
MPLQNRVDPWGILQSVPARGAWLGNRGILHDENKQVVAPWRHKSWVTCKLEFQGRKREIFSPGKYSELFFLDEATALSAGHRPCAECRRERYNEFKAIWCAANLENGSSTDISVAQIDKQLHMERAVRGGGKVTYRTDFGAVPAGAFIEIGGGAFLLWQGRLHQWSVHGYSPSNLVPSQLDVVTMLTPASIVRVLQHGFRPQVHESASG